MTILNFLAKEGHKHAVETNTKNAERFGIPRLPTEDKVEHAATPLGGRYAQGEIDIKSFLLPRLKAYKETGEKFKEVSLPPFTLRVRILEHYEVTNLKQNSFEATLVKDYIEHFNPNQINGVIIAEVGMTLEGKFHSLTAHLSTFRVEKLKGPTPTYKDFSERSLEDFKLNSKVLLAHQGSPEIFQHLIADLGNLFERAIQWDKVSVDELNQLTAEMHYKLAHLMYYHRGSAAISEWLIRTIYQYHDFQNVAFKQNAKADLKALVSPFMRGFIHNYVSYFEENPALPSINHFKS